MRLCLGSGRPRRHPPRSWGAKPFTFWNGVGAAGTAQARKIDDFRPAQKPQVPSENWLLCWAKRALSQLWQNLRLDPAALCPQSRGAGGKGGGEGSERPRQGPPSILHSKRHGVGQGRPLGGGPLPTCCECSGHPAICWGSWALKNRKVPGAVAASWQRAIPQAAGSGIRYTQKPFWLGQGL